MSRLLFLILFVIFGVGGLITLLVLAIRLRKAQENLRKFDDAVVERNKRSS